MSLYRPTTHDFRTCSETDREHVEREFFARVFLPNNTVKTTYARRLDDLNRLAWPHIANLGIPKVRIMDVGASSGVSTAEWYDHLVSNGIGCEMVATDLVVTATAISLSPAFSILTGKTGELLHFDIFGRGCPPNRSGLHLNGLVQAVTIAVISIGSRLGLTRTESISLLSKRFLDNAQLHVIEDDLLAENRPDLLGAFDVVRAANILNVGYFTEATIIRMVANLKHRLRDGALLIVCRTDKAEVTNGTIFRLSGDRFSVLEKIGAGSEIQDLVAQI